MRSIDQNEMRMEAGLRAGRRRQLRFAVIPAIEGIPLSM
jgi:hypothetical protein